MFSTRSLTCFSIVLALLTVLMGCGKDEKAGSAGCYSKNADSGTGSSGAAFAFLPDPLVRSGRTNLTPQDPGNLDPLRAQVGLQNLGGHGVLEGRYVDIRNGLSCGEKYGT